MAPCWPLEIETILARSGFLLGFKSPKSRGALESSRTALSIASMPLRRNLPFFGWSNCAGNCSGSYGPSRTLFSAGPYPPQSP